MFCFLLFTASIEKHMRQKLEKRNTFHHILFFAFLFFYNFIIIFLHYGPFKSATFYHDYYCSVCILLLCMCLWFSCLAVRHPVGVITSSTSSTMKY